MGTVCVVLYIGLWDGQLSLSPVAPVLLQCSVVICCGPGYLLLFVVPSVV